jgi:hypothetical protein
MPELIQTLKSIQKSESDKRRFLASIQGVNLEGDSEETEGPSFEDVQRRAMGISASGNDIVSLQGQFAAQAGFGIGAGLGYERG